MRRTSALCFGFAFQAEGYAKRCRGKKKKRNLLLSLVCEQGMILGSEHQSETQSQCHTHTAARAPPV